MSMQTLLRDVIETELYNLDKVEPGTKEHSTAVEDVVKLMNVNLEYDKMAVSEEQTEKQMRENRHALWTKSGIDFTQFLIGVGLTAAGIAMTFTFEEKGSITSKIGTKLLDRAIRIVSKN